MLFPVPVSGVFFLIVLHPVDTLEIDNAFRAIGTGGMETGGDFGDGTRYSCYKTCGIGTATRRGPTTKYTTVIIS